MLNKKGQIYNILFIVIFFSLLASIVFFVGYMTFTIGNDYIAVPLNNISSQTNYSTEIIGAIDEVGNDYHNTNLSFFDYGFVLGFSIVTMLGFYYSYKSNRLGYFSWLAGVLYVNMILLFVLGISLLYTNWFFDMILQVMPNLNLNYLS